MTEREKREFLRIYEQSQSLAEALEKFRISDYAVREERRTDTVFDRKFKEVARVHKPTRKRERNVYRGKKEIARYNELKELRRRIAEADNECNRLARKMDTQGYIVARRNADILKQKLESMMSKHYEEGATVYHLIISNK